jgi:hypothetical protein
MSGADGASVGAVSVEVDRTSLWLGDATRGSLRYLVMRGANLGLARCVVPGDAILAPRFSGTVGPGVAGQPLLGSPGFPPLPID